MHYGRFETAKNSREYWWPHCVALITPYSWRRLFIYRKKKSPEMFVPNHYPAHLAEKNRHRAINLTSIQTNSTHRDKINTPHLSSAFFLHLSVAFYIELPRPASVFTPLSGTFLFFHPGSCQCMAKLEPSFIHHPQRCP